MNDVLKKIRGLSIAPHDPETLKRWLEQEDALLFLEENATEDEIVVYAGLPHTFIHGVLVPKAVVTPADIEDLLRG